MKTQVWKYLVPLESTFTMRLPKDSDILYGALQSGKPCIWVCVEPLAELETRSFECYGTGHDIEGIEGLVWVATYLLHNDNLVLHIFERVS